MGREKLEHLVITGMIERKHTTENRQEKILDRPTKWLKIGKVTDALKATRDQDARKVMIAYTKK